MTLPSSPPLSALQIENELNLSPPFSLNHPWVIALAGASSLPISMSQLLGKSGSYVGGSTDTGSPGGTLSASFPSGTVLFGGSLANLLLETIPGPQYILALNFNSAPNWSGNFHVYNISTGTSIVMPKVNGTTWQLSTTGGGNPYSGMVSGTGHQDQYSIQPA